MQRESGVQPAPTASFNQGADPLTLPLERPQAAAAPRRHPVRNTLIVLVLLALAGAAVLRILQTRKAAQEKSGPGGRGGGAGGLPVPVVAGTVAQKDVPIYLDGLGTIQALNTVTVRARVDGQIEKIAFKEGQDVQEGELLAQIDPAPLQAAVDQALAKQRQDEVQYANAQRDLQRDTELVKKNVIAAQQFDYQRAQAEQLAAQVKNDEAAVANAKVQLAYTTITSPLNGRTGIRLVDQGNIVHASDATGIVTITQLKPISLVFTLPEQSLLQINRKQAEGNLEVLAIARDNKTVLSKGKLTVIDNQIDTSTGTIKLKAEFANEDYSLWPGQFANARLLVDTKQGGLVVPASVIQRGPDGSYAYIIGADLSVEMRPVKVTQIESGEALVEEGLALGEKVVVDGQYKLQPGSHVRLGDAPARGGGANPGGHAAPGKAEAGGKPENK